MQLKYLVFNPKNSWCNAYPQALCVSHQDWELRPGPNAAPLMCRTKLNKVRLRSDFRATVDSDRVLVSNLIREACGKQFSMRKYTF